MSGLPAAAIDGIRTFIDNFGLGRYAVLTEFFRLLSVTVEVVSTVGSTLAIACLDFGGHAINILRELVTLLTAAFCFLQQCAILAIYVTVRLLDWLNCSCEWLVCFALRTCGHVTTHSVHLFRTITMLIVEHTYNLLFEIYTIWLSFTDAVYPHIQSAFSSIIEHLYAILHTSAWGVTAAIRSSYDIVVESTIPLVILVTIAAALLVKLPNYLSQRGFTFPSINRYNDDETQMPFLNYITDSDLDDPSEDEALESDSDDSDADTNFADEESSEFDQTPDVTSSEDEENNQNIINIQLPRRSRHRAASQCRATPLVHDLKPSPGDLKRSLESERDKRLCVVCQDKLKNVLVLPCRHVCLCVDCAHIIATATTRQQRTCPLCRSPVETVMNVYV